MRLRPRNYIDGGGRLCRASSSRPSTKISWSSAIGVISCTCTTSSISTVTIIIDIIPGSATVVRHDWDRHNENRHSTGRVRHQEPHLVLTMRLGQKGFCFRYTETNDKPWSDSLNSDGTKLLGLRLTKTVCNVVYKCSLGTSLLRTSQAGSSEADRSTPNPTYTCKFRTLQKYIYSSCWS